MFIAEFSVYFTETWQLALTTVPRIHTLLSLPLPLNFCFSKSVTLFSPGDASPKELPERREEKKERMEGRNERKPGGEKEEKPNQRTLYT